MGWVVYVSLSGIYYRGFGLGSVDQMSVGRTCAGSQVTLWSDEDLIHEKPDSLTQVFFVLLASGACWRPQLNDEKRSVRMCDGDMMFFFVIYDSKLDIFRVLDCRQFK